MSKKPMATWKKLLIALTVIGALAMVAVGFYFWVLMQSLKGFGP